MSEVRWQIVPDSRSSYIEALSPKLVRIDVEQSVMKIIKYLHGTKKKEQGHNFP